MRFEPKRLIRIPDAQIVEEIRRVVADNHGLVPSTVDFSRLAKISIATIRDRFGSYEDAIAKAGFAYKHPSAKYTAENVTADLRRVLEHFNGGRFSYGGYRQYGGVFSRGTIMSCLGLHRWSDVMGIIGAAIEQPALDNSSAAKGDLRRERRRDDLSDENLLDEIGRVWRAKGRRPTYTEFTNEGAIDGEAYRLRFGSWSEAIERYCSRAGVRFQQRAGTHVTKAMLLAELTSVCGKRPGDLITYDLYRKRGGTYSKGPFFAQFGSWVNAVKAAGATPGSERKHSIDELFDEIQRLWEEIGQQPTWHEMVAKGNISPKVYEKAFGSWKKSILAFCDDRNRETENSIDSGAVTEIFHDQHLSYPEAPNTPNPDPNQERRIAPLHLLEQDAHLRDRPHPRYPSPKLRFQIFLRDKFQCRFCGRTQKHDGVRMVIDHIVPYSEGGRTIIDNLQLLCDDCNSGKSNIVI